MLICDVFQNVRSLMFFNGLIQVSACVADSALHRSLNNALLVNNRGFAFFWPDVGTDLSGCVHRMDNLYEFAT